MGCRAGLTTKGHADQVRLAPPQGIHERDRIRRHGLCAVAAETLTRRRPPIRAETPPRMQAV